jgi:Flp pilus assembly protein TadG
MGVPRERGFVLIAMAVTMVLMLAMIGLAFDIGRIYITRNEAQMFCDSAAMTAASRMDGTTQGLARARDAVEHLPMRWNLGTQPFTGVVVEFSADGMVWEKEPKDPASLAQVRVTTPQNGLDIVFLRAVGGPASFSVPARSVAGANPVRLLQ